MENWQVGLLEKAEWPNQKPLLPIWKYFFKQAQKLKGKKALVTAGPTYEAIDPVRFIGNHSSGKMGYAIAEELA